jgi:hypothetical protein
MIDWPVLGTGAGRERKEVDSMETFVVTAVIGLAVVGLTFGRMALMVGSLSRGPQDSF